MLLFAVLSNLLYKDLIELLVIHAVFSGVEDAVVSGMNSNFGLQNNIKLSKIKKVYSVGHGQFFFNLFIKNFVYQEME